MFNTKYCLVFFFLICIIVNMCTWRSVKNRISVLMDTSVLSSDDLRGSAG